MHSAYEIPNNSGLLTVDLHGNAVLHKPGSYSVERANDKAIAEREGNLPPARIASGTHYEKAKAGHDDVKSAMKSDQVEEPASTPKPAPEPKKGLALKPATARKAFSEEQKALESAKAKESDLKAKQKEAYKKGSSLKERGAIGKDLAQAEKERKEVEKKAESAPKGQVKVPNVPLEKDLLKAGPASPMKAKELKYPKESELLKPGPASPTKKEAPKYPTQEELDKIESSRKQLAHVIDVHGKNSPEHKEAWANHQELKAKAAESQAKDEGEKKAESKIKEGSANLQGVIDAVNKHGRNSPEHKTAWEAYKNEVKAAGGPSQEGLEVSKGELEEKGRRLDSARSDLEARQRNLNVLKKRAEDPKNKPHETTQLKKLIQTSENEIAKKRAQVDSLEKDVGEHQKRFNEGVQTIGWTPAESKKKEEPKKEPSIKTNKYGHTHKAEGKTFPAKDLLKDAGFKWDPDAKAWTGSQKEIEELERISAGSYNKNNAKIREGLSLTELK